MKTYIAVQTLIKHLDQNSYIPAKFIKDCGFFCIFMIKLFNEIIKLHRTVTSWKSVDLQYHDSNLSKEQKSKRAKDALLF